MIVTLKALERLGLQPESTRVVIQGFGNVGGMAAKLMAAKGFKITCIIEYDGAVYNPDGLDIAGLLADIEARILHHVAMPKHLAFVCALWIAQTWVHEHATYSPILFITSPERDSGKSTLINVIKFMVRRELSTVSITAAAIQRS